MPRYKDRRIASAAIAIAASVALLTGIRSAEAQAPAPQTPVTPTGQLVPGGAGYPGAYGGSGHSALPHGGGSHGRHGGQGLLGGRKGCCPTHGVCHHSRWEAHMAYCRDKYLGYPEEFIPRPLGEALYDNMKVQVSNGDAARMVLYDFDFQPNGPRLNTKGQDRLARIAQLAGSNFQPIIVERTPMNTQLAESRRQAVLAELAKNSAFPIPAERVVVGAPIAYGLDGPSGLTMWRTMMQRTSQSGPPVSENAGGFTSSGFAPQ